ncbi:autotransporter domain-containing protein [Pannonibacter phragmitetus]|uniref:autotransporter outer membrane beta-barrel domain-containing protein n=1 Tax=Pannonibacter phragmitetus TaxID=121719 RepID=UPI003D2EAFE3
MGADAGTLTLNGGTLRVTSSTTISNLMTIGSGNGAINVGTGASILLQSVLSGAGTLTKSGAGSLILTADNSSYTAAILASGGTLVVQNALGTSDLTIGASGTLELNQTASRTFSNLISGDGALTKTGTGTSSLTGDASGFSGAATVSAGVLRVANAFGGNVTVATSGTFELDQSSDRTFASVFQGTGALAKSGSGISILSGVSGAFAGTTTVSGGSLLVNGTLGSGSSLLEVASGGTLGGTGTVGGAATVQSGGTLSPGASPGTLTVNGNLTLEAGSTTLFELNTPNVAGGATNDFISVGGNLTLGGALQAQVGSAGYYNLFGYGGSLSGTFASTNVTGVTGANVTIDTSLANQVNLSVTTGGGGGQSIQFWDGSNTTANNAADGGSGTWDGTATNWTASNGASNAAWGKSVGVFMGTAGTVTVSGTQDFDTLQFKTTGYQLTGGTLALSPASGQAGTLNADAGVTATIASTIADGTGTQLSKQGSGTVVLSGTNTYTGGTSVGAGTLIGNTGSIRGNIANAGTVEFAQAANGTFAGTIGGLDGVNGQMVKSGAGTLRLTGASSLPWSIQGGSVVSTTTLFTGDVMVAAGTNLTFDQSFDGTYAGAVSGAGDVLYTGGGLVRLTGNNAAYQGEATVRDFTLTLGGNTMGGALVLSSGGRLAGNGTVGVTTVTQGGTIAPGNSIGKVTVAGNLTFLPGSTYEVETDPGSSAADLIHATGTATLAGNVLHIGFNGAYALSSTYTILTADGGINGTFNGVSSTLAFLNPSLLYGTNAVRLQLARNDITFVSLAQTENQRAAASATERQGAGNAVYDAVVKLDQSSIPPAYDALSGEIHASLKTGLIADSRFVRDAVIDRARSVSTAACLMPEGSGSETAVNGCATGTSGYGVGVWTRAFGSFGSFDGDGNASGLNTRTGGVMIGSDAAISDEAIVGLVAGYQASSYKINRLASKAETSSVFAGVYGAATLDSIKLTGGASYAWSGIDTARTVTFPGYSGYLTSSANANTAQVFGEIGYEFDAGMAVVEPFAGLTYTAVSTDGYAETGGSSALTIASSTTNLTYSTLGVRAATALPFGDAVSAKLTGMAGWRHVYGSTSPSSLNAFAGGTPFSVKGTPVGKDVALLSAGLEFDLGAKPDMSIESASFSISYDGQFGSGTVENSANARLRLKF